MTLADAGGDDSLVGDLDDSFWNVVLTPDSHTRCTVEHVDEGHFDGRYQKARVLAARPSHPLMTRFTGPGRRGGFRADPLHRRPARRLDTHRCPRRRHPSHRRRLSATRRDRRLKTQLSHPPPRSPRHHHRRLNSLPMPPQTSPVWSRALFYRLYTCSRVR